MTQSVQREVRVVIVDDTPDIRMIIKWMLESYQGVAVVAEACDGLDGIAQVARTQPDVVVLDLEMPRMDGLTALPQIRASAPDCQVIVVSACLFDSLGVQALQAGATAYVQKGMTCPQRLIAEISDALGHQLTKRPASGPTMR